ncbi:extracellular solute-binding protein [Glycomyces tenuis]|uniref:extracellular solute-binding protein n=1 Tax=Glycomyces tenuis TaxID=58116 RepID=UPI0005576608|nr:extracellular solute-binding protein [Glycomyces tenuis]
MGRVREFLGGPLMRRSLLLGTGAAIIGYGGYVFGEYDRPRKEWEDLGDRPLKLYSPRDDTANRQRILLIDQWNAMHPKHQVDIVEHSNITDLSYSVIHARLQAEDPDVDVVELDVPWIAEFAAAGYIQPLEDVDSSGFIDRTYEAGVVDGEDFALPFHSDVGMLYYRKDFVSDERAAALSDWESLRELIGEVAADGGFEGGIAMQLDAYEGFTVNVWEYLLANGVDTAENGSIDFGPGSRAVELLETMAGDIHPELGSSSNEVPNILPTSLQFDEDASRVAFQEGRTPLLRHWPRAFSQLPSCDPDFEVGVRPMPGGVLGGRSLAISAFSERRVVSQALIEFLTGPASQQLIFERGGFAATRHEPYYDAVAQIENILESNEVPEDDEAAESALLEELRCEEAGDSLPRMEAEQLHTALESAGRRPGVERYTQFSQAFHGFLHGRFERASAPDLDGLGEALQDAIEGR